MEGKYVYIVEGRISKGDNLTFEGDTIHKTRESEDIHILNIQRDYEANENLIITISWGGE